ncbi:lysostaphin resistance A-like protein [Streptomyces sp. 7N604]|uniref:lysostaphin resistance A-like protein n=1 Tax=Streptomyces sp. 7N604 TaxID=3457415 RepID=UPI003FD4E246
MIAVDEFGVLAADGRSTQMVGHLAELVVWVWLALEVAGRWGISAEHLGLVRGHGSRERAQAWMIGFAYAMCTIVGMAAWTVLALVPGPVLHGDQAAAAGVPTLGAALAHGFWSAVVEELLITAVVVGVLTAARRPLWECIAVSVLMRTLPHAYVGLPMLAVLPLGVASAWLYHRYRRVTPLVLAHASYNTFVPAWSGVPLAVAVGTGLFATAAWMRAATAPGRTTRPSRSARPTTADAHHTPGSER